MHVAIDVGHGMTNWPSNVLQIQHSGEHFVADGLTVAGYSAAWDSSLCLVYDDLEVVRMERDACEMVVCNEGSCNLVRNLLKVHLTKNAHASRHLELHHTAGGTTAPTLC
jgi:hypothetical protein